MDQGVLPLSQTEEEKTSGSIVPLATPEAYWLSPYGSPGPGSTNTTYIVGHSWEGRSTAFNNISTRSRLGDQLMLTTAKGSLSYQVTAITTENKETLRASGIWAKVPGRLILITCYTEDLWGTNIIIEASPLGSVQLVG
jgi:LPXTG-site transpeptidase (sortase) family protein